MESRGLSQDPAQDPSRPPTQLFEDDSVSLAPRSQEGNLLNDQGGISVVDSVVSTEEDAFIPKEPSSGNSDCLRKSGHFTTALSFVNSSLAEHLANTSKTGGSKFSGFGPASYPGRCRSKVCAASRVDKSLGMSQFLLLGTVANFTLAKRQEILDKSTVSEALQHRLVSSPLSKDKLFSVSLEQLQEEVNKAPPGQGGCEALLHLPPREDSLSQFKGRKLHQGLENLHLHAWLLSGIPSEREAFLTEKRVTSGSVRQSTGAVYDSKW
ncbi:unnamed protein product [Mytilus edulis]|uniref:Uncharacterized protein n=1 Tax=Mytilus edulis TaxID=6550 RepID=A0A8S3R1L6_MYTED|nr:unnamed protein product [Mytilus edulis]